MSLPSWLAEPALLPVWQRLRAPLERGSRRTRLTGLPRETRHALGAVLGRPVLGDVTVVLADLDALLANRGGTALREVVETATGPLRDRGAERTVREAPLAVLAGVDPDWAASVRASGVLTRLPDAVALARTAVAVRAQLPGPARLRTELAAAGVGDAHALDDGSPLASVVLRAFGPVPATPAERRKRWESVGVHGDRVSTTVLTLGLRPVASGSRELALRAAADRGVHQEQVLDVLLAAWP